MSSTSPEPAGPGPGVETRRTREFAAELVARLRTWVPGWNPDADAADPGRALLEVSARLLGQVAERLDRGAEKNRRNLYTWLGLRGLAARGARLPIVFKLTDSARAAVLASAPVQLQADAAGTSLVFETDADLRLVPARVALVAAVDPVHDRYYLPADGYASLEPAPLLPSSWAVVSLARAHGALLQLDPPLGLSVGMIIEVGGKQFRITAVNADIVGIDPKIDIAAGIAAGSTVTRVDSFAPFDGPARSRQQHALYFGHNDLFDIESTARIEIEAGLGLAGFEWQYWGKHGSSGASDWQPLAIAGAADKANPSALVLEKQAAGAIEPLQIGDAQTRWLRARSAELPAASQPLQLARLSLRVLSAKEPARPVLEGLANASPLVLDAAFLPLGREPRQFDAFYLGCSEVFAKRRASVTIDLKVSDGTFASLSTPQEGPNANQLLAGVARDQSLHLLRLNPIDGTLAGLPDRDALQPPDPGVAGRAALAGEPRWRLPVWHGQDQFVIPVGSITIGCTRIAVVAGTKASVWIWREFDITGLGGWITAGQPIPRVDSSAEVTALVHLPGADEGTLYAICEGELYMRGALSSGDWTPLAPAGKSLTMLAPIVEGSGAAPLAGAAHLVAVDQHGALFAVHDNGQLDTLVAAATPAKIANDVQPIALRTKTDGDIIVVVANPAHDAVTAIRTSAPISPVSLTLLPAGQTVLGFDFDDAVEGGTIVASVADGLASRLLWWAPDFTHPAQKESADAPLDLSTGVLSGYPLRLPQRVLVPGQRAAVFLLPLLNSGAMGEAPLQLWAQIPLLAEPLVAGDVVTVNQDGIAGLATLPATPTAVGSASYLRLSLAAAIATSPSTMFGFHTNPMGTKLSATVLAKMAGVQTDLLLTGANDVKKNDWILTDASPRVLRKVDAIVNAPPGETHAIIKPDLPEIIGATVNYWPSVHTGGQASTVLCFDQVPTGLPAVDPPDLDSLTLSFDPPADPDQRLSRVLTRGAGNRPASALLTGPRWTTHPPTFDPGFQVHYRVLAGAGNWTRALGESDANPELSWEYSNGRSWWRLQQQFSDTTNGLKRSGQIEFQVPDDIIASDWAGRTNFWIRARLVGGDYGREVFTVTATTNANVTTQSVTRSTVGVRPPIVVSLVVTYAMHDALAPEQLLAEDAGTLRNLGDANRTPGASIEAFVPLAIQLARLSGGAAATAVASIASASCCASPLGGCVEGTSEVLAAAAATPAAAAAPGPALMIGIDGVAEGAPIQLLFAVGAEHDHDACAPLKVEALVGGRFEPVVAQDATRALGESGIVVLAIAHAPSVTEMFGRALSWLRISPTTAAAIWKPSLLGAWLNAAWVEAAQTQTREVLGSSQGAPNLVVTLARPPLLHATLKLRVNEPLGDEEVAALRAPDASAVLTEVDGLPGQWVLWSAVDDVADAAVGARVYALDEASGDVTFGDGLSGMIPPIGRDNIVAFTYRRTEPLKALTPDTPPPQIAIAVRDKLGLITPLEGVEAAIAALASDAGVPADDAARVLRFAPARLRHRERALSGVDLEALALQAMPAIAQARCLRAATGAGALRLVVVMRGLEIAPVRAVQRELKRLLLAAMPPGFGAAGSGLALEIVAPRPRRLRVRAELSVATLELAGGVAERAQQALRQRLDPASGGDDRLGWPLGAAPDEGEIAATLIDTPALDGIEHLTLIELVATGAEAPWPAALNADELAVLAEDGFDFKYLLPKLTP